MIVVMSGGGARYQYAVKLFKDGHAKYILFNYNGQDTVNVVGMKFDAEEMIRNLASLNGIPLEKVFTDGRSTSTYEDIMFAKENIIKNRFKSAIFVSSNFHMRRVYLTFQKVFKGSDIKAEFIHIPKEMEGIDPSTWWSSEHDLIKVFNEYVKLIFYYFKYGI